MDRLCVNGAEFTYRELVGRVVRNLKSPLGYTMKPRWFLAMQMFSLDALAAQALCREFDLDPEKLV